MRILVTGTAGFIGFHLASRLCGFGHEVIGIDNINAYYDTEIKYGRLEESGIERESIGLHEVLRSSKHPNYAFAKMDLTDRDAVFDLFERERFDTVCHLAAQAGVRYSITNPFAYIESNVNGFMNVLESCRKHGIRHLVYASSSSVYGLNESMPFSTRDNVDHPVSLYAATKKSNELMAHTYSYLHDLPTTGLRFFTVYGPWGRPDMALFLFTSAILEGRPIEVYNNGDMERDFTYIDDVVEGIVRAMDRIPVRNGAWDAKKPDPSSSPAPYRIYNIGHNAPVRLMDFIEAIESALGEKAVKNFLPLQPGDVPRTWADSSELINDLGYTPATDLKKGIAEFIAWYRRFYEKHRSGKKRG